MPQPSACPRCGSQLAPTAAQGAICARCMLAQGIADSESRLDDEHATGERRPREAPPEIAELAALFPELEIVELLGQGGMGAVYKARQRALDRWVALKLLTPRAGDEQAFAARFEREARTLARLTHENIVGIHASGRVEGHAYLLMEYVDGLNLRQLIRQGALDVPKALALVRQVCDALEYAHAQGVVHRDIKPENVLIDKRGRVKIADFGLAKIVGEEQSGEPITRTQQSMGTPQYMAPEQLTRSRDVDHRADIYSLGVVFYELLTGELPLGRFEPPSRHVQVDVRLDELVLRALEREPERRYQHASEIKTGIERLDEPVPRAAPIAAPSASPLERVEAPSLTWLVLAWPASQILEGALEAFDIAREQRERAGIVWCDLVLVLLCACTWFFRRDRRGAVLRFTLGTVLASAVVVCTLQAQKLLSIVQPLLHLEPRAADLWIARVFLAGLGFEALRIAWSGRSALAASLRTKGQRVAVDAVVVLASAYLAWIYGLGWPSDWRMGLWRHLPVLLCVLAVVADQFTLRSAQGPAGRPWQRRSPPLAPRTGPPWLRRIALPTLIALSAWIMARYTFAWGWFGAIASSAVLALAVVGYLLQTIPEQLRQELQAERPSLRVLRALFTFLVLAAGALALGDACVEHVSRGLSESLAQRPSMESLPELPASELAQLAALVAANAHEEIDPLKQLPKEVATSHLVGGANGSAAFLFELERKPDPVSALVLILVAPAILLWTKRWGNTWRGCWRFAFEALLVVLLGLAASLLVLSIQHLLRPAADRQPLIVQAALGQGIEKSRAKLADSLIAEGFHTDTNLQVAYGRDDVPLLLVDLVGAHVESAFERLTLWPGVPARKQPPLWIELAGTPGPWASAIRIDAGSVNADQRAKWTALLERIVQRVR